MGFNQFLIKHGIEAKKYLPSKTDVIVLPTKNDLQKFAGMLIAKDLEYGTRRFKKNCAITKEWVEIANTINTPNKPTYFEYGLHLLDSYTNRCFMIGDVLYGSVECKSAFKLLDFMEEIKASEFYKAIEDEEIINANDE